MTVAYSTKIGPSLARERSPLQPCESCASGAACASGASAACPVIRDRYRAIVAGLNTAEERALWLTFLAYRRPAEHAERIDALRALYDFIGLSRRARQ